MREMAAGPGPEAKAFLESLSSQPLLNAADSGDVVEIKRLLSKEGGDIPVDTRGYRCEETALMLACINGHEDAVKALVAAGASLDLRDKNGYTALMTASFSAQPLVVWQLLQAGADRSVRSYREGGSTALSLAERCGR